MKKALVAGGVVIVVSGVAALVYRAVSSRGEDAYEEEPAQEEEKEHEASEASDEVKLEPLPKYFPEDNLEQLRFEMDEERMRYTYEFQHFKSKLSSSNKADFEMYYEQLKDHLYTHTDVDMAHQVGAVFAASVILRNKLDKTYFNQGLIELLEGKSTMIPRVVGLALFRSPEEVKAKGVHLATRALDYVLLDITRPEYLTDEMRQKLGISEPEESVQIS